MTKDLAQFLQSGERDDRGQAPALPRSKGWHLNDNDLSVIDDLHAKCVEWLSFAKNGKSARVIAAALETLEAISAGHPVASMIEIDVARKRQGEDGLSVVLQIAPDRIELSSIEWVWMTSGQGHDHAHTLRAELSKRGGLDHDAVDHWLYLSDFATDEDQTVLLTSHSRDRDLQDAD